MSIWQSSQQWLRAAEGGIRSAMVVERARYTRKAGRRNMRSDSPVFSRDPATCWHPPQSTVNAQAASRRSKATIQRTHAS
eukprot:5258545-Pyramimonas_sp.AAC.1